jgi:tRNA-2-methylthio-N6-dimethylallyladenosine synthase
MEEYKKHGRTSVWIETYGCQMNKYDSEIIAGMIRGYGYDITEDSKEADVILVNTCSVREHAEKRALGRISVLAHLKKVNPHKKIGVIGCMAQRMHKELVQSYPFLDFIIGPDEYRKIPLLIGAADSNNSIQFNCESSETYSDIIPARKSRITGWVAIMRGCNNFCTYCIVPYTRGRERSRPANDILKEISIMATQGYREVILLGQNVNSYFDGENDFPELLNILSQIPKILRIRFMTSHPKDLSEKLLKIIASKEKICPHIHLPVQSGSNKILSKMNRGYTREYYFQIVEKARKLIPDIAITSDVMVGFPGESKTDFMDTFNLMEKVRFTDAFTYHFSIREGTAAAKMNGQITQKVKLERLNKIIQLQRQISLEEKQKLIGQCVEILPECLSKQSSNEWMGKTATNEVIIFPENGKQPGRLVKVVVETCKGSTLRGRIFESDPMNGQN